MDADQIMEAGLQISTVDDTERKRRRDGRRRRRDERRNGRKEGGELVFTNVWRKKDRSSRAGRDGKNNNM